MTQSRMDENRCFLAYSTNPKAVNDQNLLKKYPSVIVFLENADRKVWTNTSDTKALFLKVRQVPKG